MTLLYEYWHQVCVYEEKGHGVLIESTLIIYHLSLM